MFFPGKNTPAPTGPAGLPVVGHLPAFLRDRLGFLSRCAERGDAVTALRIGGPTLLLNDWDDIRHVLVSNASAYGKTPRLTSPRGRKLSGSGVLTATGAEHLAQRRLLQPIFHASVMERFVGGVFDALGQATAHWCDGAERDLRADMMSLTRGAVLRALFGRGFTDIDGRLARAIEARQRSFHFHFFSLFPRPELLPAPSNFAHRRALEVMERVIRDAIVERRRAVAGDRDAVDAGTQAAAPHDDLLSLFLAARRPDGSAMSDDLVRDEVRTLMVTGHETVGEALTWTWSLLTRHPDIVDRLAREADEVLGEHTPVAADLPQLRVATMVMAEGLRLRPPTWLYPRVAHTDDQLPSGAPVPRGTKLYLCPWTVHRNPRYFPDPERFDPERFADLASGGRAPAGWFPFGAGPRVCLGETLARMEIVLALAATAQRWRLELLEEGTCLDAVPGITLFPRQGPRVRLHARSRGD